MFGYVYKTTCKVTGLIYVGKHKATKFEPYKYIGSGAELKREIKKYGHHNFICELICTADTNIDLKNLEDFWIDFLDATNPLIGYNKLKTGSLNREAAKSSQTKAESNRKWYLANKEYVAKVSKEYAKAHKEEIYLRRKQWRLKNLDKIKIRQDTWRQQNRQKLAEKSAEYYKNNKQAVRDRFKLKYKNKKATDPNYLKLRAEKLRQWRQNQKQQSK